jgi:dTDP-3-amino-3,4,6-trideoxy-alpha-D-glucose transaminase
MKQSLGPLLLNDFAAQWEQNRELTLSAVERVGRSGWLILGQEVRRFEDLLAQYLGVRSVIGCANGLDAIEIGLRCLGIKNGQKVLTTPLSAFATTLAIIRAGGVPVFVDVDNSGLMDLAKARAALELDPAVKFIVPVHLYGHAMNLRELQELKNTFQLKVVEDCAQAIGAKSEGRSVGTVGDISATSFYPTKNLGCMGDGGAMFSNDDELAQKARVLRDYGQSAKYYHTVMGLNSRLDEIQAAILSDALFPFLEKGTIRRREIAARYLQEIKQTAIILPSVPDGSYSVWHLFPVLVKGNRDQFMSHLKSSSIQSGIHYPILITDQAALGGKDFGKFENAERFAQAEVSLPIHPFLSDEDVSRVIDATNSWQN